MVRTRVGYSGGTKESPTYYNLGDQSESIQIDYDPTVISYQLLDIFWESHRPEYGSISCQYRSIVLYHNEEQRELAEKSRERVEEERGAVDTEIAPFVKFWLAEDYHQKYSLQQVGAIYQEFKAIYPEHADFVDSTAAARVNGFLGGNGSLRYLEQIIDSLGLSPRAQNILRERAGRYARSPSAA